MNHVKLIVIFALSSVGLLAQSASKSTLIAEIMKAYGIEASIEATKAEMLKQANAAMKGVVEQIRTARPDISSAGWDKINVAMEKYMNAATSSWNGADVVKVYSQIYEDNYSLKELKLLAGYVKTDGGIKSIRTAQTATKSMSDYIMSNMMNSMQSALRVFIAEMQQIISEDIRKSQHAEEPNIAVAPATAAGTSPAAQEPHQP